MAFNPFLSMNEVAAPVTTEDLNPFATVETDIDTFAVDNPFAGSNPFADVGGYEPPVGDTVPIDLFGGPQPSVGSAAAPPPAKPQDLSLTPAIPPRPLPAETQHLILTVTGQMDLTSTHLLDRIPPTRTPSPVSVRDLHSPSPTPDLDMEEVTPLPEQQQESPKLQQAPMRQPPPIDAGRNKPTRPPPARPPPAARPPPPRPGPPPRPPQVQQQADDINLFDAPVPTMVKPTKEAIMSLYSTPKKQEEKQIDFLSDDILPTMSNAMDCSEPACDNDSFIKSPFDNFESNKMDTASPFNDSVSTVNSSPFGDPVAVETPAFGLNSEPHDQSKAGFNNMSQQIAASDNAVFGNEMTQFPTNSETIATNASPFDSNIIAVTNSSPFATHKGPFECNSNTFDEQSSPFTAPTDAFKANSSPFTNDTVTLNSDTQPFGDSIDPLTSETNVFTSAANNIALDSGSVTVGSSFTSGIVDNGTLKSAQQSETVTFVEETQKNTGTFNSPFGEASNNESIFGSRRESEGNPFETPALPMTTPAWGATSEPMAQDAFSGGGDDTFDAFTAKFDSAAVNHVENDAWGASAGAEDAGAGFEAEAFDSFLDMQAPPPPPPSATPYTASRASPDSGDDNFSLVIRPKEEGGVQAPVPALAPPPKPAEAPRVNPFEEPRAPPPAPPPGLERDPDSPPTPLFDEDVSMPLEPFPRTTYSGPGWEMQLRQPNKKKITGQRFWKKIFVRLVYQGDSPVVQLLNSSSDKEPFQELPLQPCYSVSEVGAQQYDQFGKIFTVKLQYVFYKERPGVRPGQVTKAERLTTKLSAFAAYAIQGDYQGVKEFGSDLRKLGLPVEHAPQVSQLFKIGSLNHEDVVQFSCCVEEAMFRLQAHRDRALTYKMEEVQITSVDELYVEQDAEGAVIKQIARVRIFFLGFLNGMPDVEVGVNDLRRQGREVVGRHDIIPVVTEEWIRVEDAEFHACVQTQAFNEAQLLRFRPPDACYVEVLRFRVRPPRNRELPLLLRAAWAVRGARVELRADVLVAGFASRALGQVPCEDVAIRFPVPESWIYLFRVEKHFRYGSVKSAHRRTGKIKGIERFLGAVDTLQESLIEVTSGQAKYEHQHRAVVWRMPRLPKEGQGAYTTHNLVMRLALTSFDQIPSELASHAHVSFSMPATQVSHVTIRSVALPDHDDPPEKYVRYLARHEYIVGIERTSGESPAPAYVAAAKKDAPPAPAPAPAAPAAPAAPSSDSDSD